MKKFKNFFHNAGFEELERKSLISKHDRSIRFTNSTSSVMKPFFQDNAMEQKVMLIQPALGFQGINYWYQEQKIDRFSSYFYSFGIMCGTDNLNEIIALSLKFLMEVLCVDRDSLFVQVHHTQLSSFNKLIKCDVQVMKDHFDEDYYIHHFGIEHVIGKTACFTIKNGNRYDYIGSVIVLEKEGVPIAIEFSFDSTLFLAAVKNSHPILELPGGQICYSEIFDNMEEKYRLILIDLLNVCVALNFEGLSAGSRGRRGNMRKILRELGKIARDMKVKQKQMRLGIDKICREEKRMREFLTGQYIDCRTCEEVAEYLMSQVFKF